MKAESKAEGTNGWGGVAGTLAMALGAGAAQGATCQAPAPSWFVERVMSARCVACWAAAGETWAPPATAVVLDWIVPAEDDAPLQAAALSLARERWPAGQGSDGDPVNATHTAHRVWPLPARTSGLPRLQVQDGPAWNGYIGLSLRVARSTAAASLPRARQPDWSAWTGHLALIEQVPAGSEGSAVARQVVRGVVGPLSLATLAAEPKFSHLQAMRLPPEGNAARWKTLGWLSLNGQPQVVAWAGEGACTAPATPATASTPLQ